MTKFQIVDQQSCSNEEAEDELPVSEAKQFDGEVWLSDVARPSSVKGAVIALDGRTDSTLDWTAQIEQAQKYVDDDIHILWKLDLGLFDALQYQLHNEQQLLTLKLSLQHFSENVWEAFKEHTIGLQIFEDSVLFATMDDDQLDQPLTHPLQQAYHRRNAVAEYLSLLTGSLPDALTVYAKIVVPETLPLSVAIALLNPDRFEKIEWILEAKHPLHSTWHVDGDRLLKSGTQQLPSGFCIPLSKWMPVAENEVDALLQKYSRLRLVAESSLLSNWDQLDTLYVMDDWMTPFGRRQLMGFQAAGGSVINV